MPLMHSSSALSAANYLLQAYELLQGPLVRWSKPGVGVTPPTAVLVHGILGSRRNMQSFARMILEVRYRRKGGKQVHHCVTLES